MLNQVLKVSSGTCQQSVEDLRCCQSVIFLDFRLSQGSVATYSRWGGNLCDVYIENFLTNHLVKEFWKSVHICQSYYQTSIGLLFSGTQCIWMWQTFTTTEKAEQIWWNLWVELKYSHQMAALVQHSLDGQLCWNSLFVVLSEISRCTERH